MEVIDKILTASIYRIESKILNKLRYLIYYNKANKIDIFKYILIGFRFSQERNQAIIAKVSQSFWNKLGKKLDGEISFIVIL